MSEQYIFKKGDSLEKIAKNFQHRDWRTIWKAPENREIVSKRREPKNLVPGDKLIIPPNEKQLKENAEKLNSLKLSRDVNLRLRAALQEDAARRTKSLKVFDDLIKDTTKATQQTIAKLQDDLNSMKNWGLAVDTAKDLVMAVKDSVFKLGKLGVQASRAAGAELVKIGKEAAEVVAEFAKEKIDEKVKEHLQEMKDDATKQNPAIAVVTRVEQYYDDVQSPSFWANTAVQMMEGKSFTEATKREIGADIKERMLMVEKSHDKHIHQLWEGRNDVARKLRQSQKCSLECDARVKAIDKEISDLQRN